MTRVKVISSILVDGLRHSKGIELDLDDDVAAKLHADGYVDIISKNGETVFAGACCDS